MFQTDPFSLIVLFVGLSLLPFVAMVATSYLKIVVVMSLIRNALGIQSIPPNMVINALAMILTFYIMAPVASESWGIAKTEFAKTQQAAAGAAAQQSSPPAAQQPAADASSDNTALQDAFNAYRTARQSDQQEELEAELKSYVASGKLTQEQADLILNYYKEQEALRNGTCPNCGYQFQNGFGKGGHGMGGRGMKGGKGGRMFGGMNMPGQQPSTQSGTDSQASGTAFEFGAQTIPFMDGTEGI